jgi:16S rRNA G1207 methylase RsmC
VENQLDLKSIFTLDIDGSNQQFRFHHPPGTFALTPASQTLIQAIVQNQNLLQGMVIDWGSGVGCLAIAAARLTKVTKV